jgi:TonB family protein
MFFKNLLACSIFSFLTISGAIAESKQSNKAAFTQAYSLYQSAIKENDEASIYKHASEAHKSGIDYFGKDSINTANLALILAQLNLTKKRYTEAMELHDDIINVFEAQFGEASLEVADIRMAFIPAYISLGNNKLIKKLLSISEEFKIADPLIYAELQFQAGLALLKLRSNSGKAILNAREVFAQHLPADSAKRVLANFFSGRYYLMKRKRKSAVLAFKENLPVFEMTDGPNHHLELTTHAFLVQAYEELGDSDAATTHCVAIGKMTPWESDQKAEPLYRVKPDYPFNAASPRKIEGATTVEFTVNTFGIVKDVKVLENEGYHGFAKSSIAAVKKWRYAPKFVDGKAVDATLKVQLTYTNGE